MKVLTIVGARPQFIKAAVVSRALAEHGGVAEVLVHTGQHFDAGMSDVFFAELGMARPVHALGIHGGGHGEMTGRMMIALEPIVTRERPDVVLVYGDTNSTLAGALVAAKLHVPVAHVEAGLRSFNRRMPEETNRVLVDRLSTLLLCPTRSAVENLNREGLREGVHAVGDVMYDAALFARAGGLARSAITEDLGLTPGHFDLATLHRAENTDSAARLAELAAWLRARAAQRPIVMPLHPRTRLALAQHQIDLADVRVIEPVGYFDMARLLTDCVEVHTDSGGLQKEAYFHGKLCTTLRDETEWVETIEAGWNRLWRSERLPQRHAISDYGHGDAGRRIAVLLAGMPVREHPSS